MRKTYGKSHIDKCPVCGKTALSVNSQKIPVCAEHKKTYFRLKCVCGESLEILTSKWGPFCNCPNCGNMSLAKALDMN